jgi:surface protein
MSSMFQYAQNLNLDISSWDVSSVTDMSSMFQYAQNLNLDISSWDVSSVTDMSSMFREAYSFNGDISSWDVSSVTNMSLMFSEAYNFNGDISAWDVSSVTDMSELFQFSQFNGDISSWDVSSVTNMSSMFEETNLSEENQCLIHTSFSSNSYWPYDWSEFCPEQEECVGEIDACGVCNGPGLIYSCGCENIPEGDCDCQGNQLDAVGTCGGACLTDINGDGVCDQYIIPGCTYSQACNYDPSASVFDDSCDFTSCHGCTDPEACNYSAAVYFDNGTCWYASFALDCEGNCLNDSDGDGLCNEFEIYGCTDEEGACNYDAGATELDESCLYVDECGICGGEGTLGCTDPAFCSFDPEADCDDGSCEEGYEACIDSEACNYDSEAICGGIECVYPGCTYEQANNYDSLAGCDDDSCIIEGCHIDFACNFDPLANTDDGSCEFGTCPGCNDPFDYNYNPTSTNDETCGLTTIFTNCGQEGRYGPSELQVFQEYGAGSGITVIDGIQLWTVPESGTYRIEAFGAQGGWVNPFEEYSGVTGGLGAKMQGYFQLNEGQMIHLLIGQMGGQNLYPWSRGGGGGGGTFVVISDNTPLIIAGAGSGGGGGILADGQPGLSDTSGGVSIGDSYYWDTNGGINGNGGGSNGGGGAGGGFYSNGDGESYGDTEGVAFLNGGYGGSNGCGESGYGGFGAGGGGEWCAWGSTGAGGGYSGGGGSGGGVSGGGGSYNSGTSQDNESGVNEGHGKVVITLIP